MNETAPPLVEVDICSQGVATLTLNRPDVLNALSTGLIQKLLETLPALRANPAVRVLLLTGRGRAFCAGADLRDPGLGLDLPAAARAERFRETCDWGVHALARAMAGFDRPKVVAVNGPAVGGGSSLALAGDIVVAARSAYFQQPFVPQLGLGPDMGASWYLMRGAGLARTLGAVMLGERIPAEQAVSWGLIWQCVDDAQLLPAAGAIALRLAQGSPAALSAIPALVSLAAWQGLDAQLDAERDLQVRMLGGADFSEALDAFRSKRKPCFTP